MMLALAQASGQLEEWAEATIDEIKAKGRSWCRMKRKGSNKVHEHAWTVQDAKEYGLWEKRGYNNTPTPWLTYKWRMLQLKPRSWCLKDCFSDMFKGFIAKEEAEEIGLVEEEGSTQGLIAAKSQVETKGAEIAKALDTKIEQTGATPVVAPGNVETPVGNVEPLVGNVESPVGLPQEPAGSEPELPLGETAPPNPMEGLRQDIYALQSVLEGSDAGQVAHNKVLGKLKVKLTKGKNPLEALPGSQWELYRSELNSAVDGLAQ
jgi:hypothetical protein